MGSVALVARTGLANDILLLAVPYPPDEKWITKLEARYPGFKVRWVFQEAKLPAPALPDELYEGVTMICTLFPAPPPTDPKLLQTVRYVQLMSAGADRWITHDLYKRPDVIFCTANGVHAPPIAEWVLGTWLQANHHFLAYAAEQSHARWKRLPDRPATDSPGMRMGILGYGAIGRQCARLAQALGMSVYAYTRSAKPTPDSRRDDSYCVPGTGDPEGVIPERWFHGASREAVDEFLAQDLDILVVSLPLTDATRYILGREQFEILGRNKKTFVSNVARGAHIDSEALWEALREGKIRGAALDVADPEPLPEGHPLFGAPNVFITPHVSFQTPHLFERVKALLERNLEGLSEGGGLVNVMDREHHY